MALRSYAEIHANLVAKGLADCDPSCLTAAEEVCTCACGGKNHGRDAEKLRRRVEQLNAMFNNNGKVATQVNV